MAMDFSFGDGGGGGRKEYESRRRKKERGVPADDPGSSPFDAADRTSPHSGFDRRQDEVRHRRHANPLDSLPRADSGYKEDRREKDPVLALFKATIRADRDVSRSVQHEIDTLHTEIRKVREESSKLERLVSEETQGEVKLEERLQNMEQQLKVARSKLGDLHADRRGINIQSLTIGRDRENYAEELQYLVRTAEAEEKTLEMVMRGNTYLEKSFRDLEAHTAALDQQRKDILQQMNAERDRLKSEQRMVEELRNYMDRLRSSGGDMSGSRRHRRDEEAPSLPIEARRHRRDDGTRSTNPYDNVEFSDTALQRRHAEAPSAFGPGHPGRSDF